MVLGAVLLSTAIPAAAQFCANAPRGYYLGLTGHQLSFRGDFDGQLVLGNSTKLFYIPGPAESTGFGLHFGCDVSRGFWRISFIRSSHRAAILDRTSRAVYNALVLDGLAYVFPRWRVTPYLQVGINIPWVTVKDGSLYENARLTDATYIGLGVNAGAGLCARIGEVFVAAGPVVRPLAFLYAYGEGRGRDVGNLYINGDGPKQPHFLEVLGLGFELHLGFRI